MAVVTSASDMSSFIYTLLKGFVTHKQRHDAAMFEQAQYQSNVLRDLLVEQRRTNDLLAQRLPAAPRSGG